MKLFKRKHSHLTKDFQTFMNDYFTGHPMIRSRGEEDTSVWDRLKGDELEIAKNKILDELPSDHEYLMRAASLFKDVRAISKLEWTAINGIDVHSRCFAAKILFDWIGYNEYFKNLDEVFKSDNQWSKTNLSFWIHGLDEELALKYFWLAMNDTDSFVRFCAYTVLENYYGRSKFLKDGSEIRYFTDEEVFNNKKLFNERQEELKIIIKQWKV